MPPPDPAAVDAAIAVVHGIASDRRKLGLNPTPQEILADACEYYRAELADGGYRIVVRCRGCKQTESTTFTSQEEAFDFSDQFSDLHAEKCGIWRSECNYCGYAAQGTKQEAIEQSKSHDLVCEKSPLAEMRQQLAAATERAKRMREALVGAKSFIENLKVPQTVSEAAEQVRQGMHRMNCIEAALNQEGNDNGR